VLVRAPRCPMVRCKSRLRLDGSLSDRCDSVCVAYSIAKCGMSLCVLGMAEELRSDGVAVNALWPKTGQ